MPNPTTIKKALLTVLLICIFLPPGLQGYTEKSPKELDFNIPGLDGRVKVYFDDKGVPDVYATTSHDLFMVQGFIHASDRWWQMEWIRHQGAGRLSELVGDTSLESDKLVREMGLPQNADHDLEIMSQEGRRLLQAYTDGVNAWIGHKQPEDLALEYKFLGQIGNQVKVEPWQPRDTMLLQGVQVLGSNQINLAAKIFRAAIVHQAGPLAADLVVPSYPYGEHPVVLKPGATTHVDPGKIELNNIAIPQLGNLFEMPALGGFGSNNWVVSGRLTTTGKPLLANDSHWEIQIPSAWYEMGLHCVPITDECPYNVDGFGFAGSPGIIAGHNQNIGWGLTNSFTDVTDIYLLTLNPANSSQYLYNGKYVDMEVTPETIQLWNGKPLTLNIRTSKFGPVFDNLYGVDLGQPFAIHFGPVSGNRSLDSVLLLNKAHNWEEFQQALTYFDFPGLHMVYADTEGNIGYVTSGLIPIRAKGDTGLLPLPGNDDSHEWQGYVPAMNNPRLFNPPEGFIVSANNPVAAPGDYPYAVCTFCDYGYRAARIEQLIKMINVHSVNTFETMQLDTYNPAASLIIPVLQGIDFKDDELNSAVKWLATWNYENAPNSPQAALFNVFWTRLMHLALDELPMYDGSHALYLMSIMLKGWHPLWSNNKLNLGMNSRDVILGMALRDSLNWLNEQWGTNRAEWKWSKLHVAMFESALPKQIGSDSLAIFTRSIPVGGGWATVNTTEWDIASEDYEVNKVASMRMILDFSDFNHSQFVNSTGQSGNPESPHYDDMMQLWANGQYHNRNLSEQHVKDTSDIVWNIHP